MCLRMTATDGIPRCILPAKHKWRPRSRFKGLVPLSWMMLDHHDIFMTKLRPSWISNWRMVSTNQKHDCQEKPSWNHCIINSNVLKPQVQERCNVSNYDVYKFPFVGMLQDLLDNCGSDIKNTVTSDNLNFATKSEVWNSTWMADTFQQWYISPSSYVLVRGCCGLIGLCHHLCLKIMILLDTHWSAAHTWKSTVIQGYIDHKFVAVVLHQ